MAGIEPSLRVAVTHAVGFISRFKSVLVLVLLFLPVRAMCSGGWWYEPHKVKEPLATGVIQLALLPCPLPSLSCASL